jgi:hypothetical protein
VAGTGAGTVTLSPAGISSGTDCSQVYVPDALVRSWVVVGHAERSPPHAIKI